MPGSAVEAAVAYTSTGWMQQCGCCYISNQLASGTGGSLNNDWLVILEIYVCCGAAAGAAACLSVFPALGLRVPLSFVFFVSALATLFLLWIQR